MKNIIYLFLCLNLLILGADTGVGSVKTAEKVDHCGKLLSTVWSYDHQLNSINLTEAISFDSDFCATKIDELDANIRFEFYKENSRPFYKKDVLFHFSQHEPIDSSISSGIYTSGHKILKLPFAAHINENIHYRVVDLRTNMILGKGVLKL